MNNLEKTSKILLSENRKALVPFITGGYPTIEKSKSILKILDEGGANIIEVGIPFSDPLADGDVISKSYYDALNNGVRPLDILEMVKDFKKESDTPVVIMVYYNIVFSRGEEAFLSKLRECNIDGLIVPDIPLEERGELLSLCEKYSISLIPLVAPTSKERLEKVLENGSGFTYCVSKKGTTGNSLAFTEDLKSYLDTCKSISKSPCYLGFGIDSKKTVSLVKDYTSGVIIGSAIVKMFLEEDSFDLALKKLSDFITEIREELDKGL